MFTVDLNPAESGNATVAICCDDEEALFLRLIAGSMIGTAKMYKDSGRDEEDSLYRVLYRWSYEHGYKPHSTAASAFCGYDKGQECPILIDVTLQQIKESYTKR